MIRRLHPIFAKCMRPDEEGSTGGGAVDRGDDWTPTDDDAADLKAAQEAKEAAKGAKDEGEKGEKAAKEGARDADETDPDEEGDDDEEGKAKDSKKGKKDTRVPLARHEEMLRKERERRENAERELAATRAGQHVAKANDDISKAEDKIKTMEAEYIKLLEEGKVADATAKMAEIRRAERAVIEQSQAVQLQAAEARAVERVRYDTTVERLEAAYPVMNPDHEDYDDEKTQEIVDLRDAFIATRKYTRAEAIQKAVKTLLGAGTKRQENATEVEVRVDKDEVAKKVAADRKKAQVEKNLDASKKQPPNTTEVGVDSDKAGGKLKASEVIKMDQDTFAKLSDAERSRLRGDDF